jgi:ribosome production factor 1
MAKKKVDPSLKGKKPINTTKRVTKVQKNPGHITNRLKRSEMYGKYLQQRRVQKREDRLKREKLAEELGEDVAITKPVPRTIDNAREAEPTMVLNNDPEVAADEADDEFVSYFQGLATPKVLITTRPRPSQNLFYFIADLQKLIPGLHFYPRKSFSIKEICQFATNKDFTHLIVLSEKAKKCNGMMISHLRKHNDIGIAGPTAFFKLSSVVTSTDIPNHGRASTSYIPELHLHGLCTRLGHRVGRLLASLFPLVNNNNNNNPQQQQQPGGGRQVVTFHNQRDYIFVRQHRYIFKDKIQQQQSPSSSHAQEAGRAAPATTPMVKTRLQELGPRFTLKLRWLQQGTFDTKFGEYEWYHKRKEMDTTRRKFHL